MQAQVQKQSTSVLLSKPRQCHVLQHVLQLLVAAAGKERGTFTCDDVSCTEHVTPCVSVCNQFAGSEAKELWAKGEIINALTRGHLV